MSAYEAVTHEAEQPLFLHLHEQGQPCMISVDAVREVLAREPLAPIPGQSPEVLGALRLRHQIMPVLSLSRLLYGRQERQPWQNLVVIRQREAPYALAVEQIGRVHPHDPEQLQDLQSQGEHSPWVQGALEHAGDVAMLLEPPRALASVVRRALSSVEVEAVQVEARREVQTSRWLGFKLQGQPMALPLGEVAEVLQASACTPVPLSSPFVRGIINVRGQVITVVDLARRLGAEPAPSFQHIVLVQRLYEGKPLLLGITVDEMLSVIQVEDEAVQPPSFLERGQSVPFLSGITRERGRSFYLLEPESLLEPEDFQSIIG